MRRFFLISLLTFLAAGCGGDELSQRSKDAMLMTLAQESVEAKLKDPNSADFRAIEVHHKDGKVAACGEVNAKNGFGGYTGFQRFISLGSKELTFIESEMKPGDMDRAWGMICEG